jgi:glycosyltransferase involved in cell wall biosynthesis
MALAFLVQIIYLTRKSIMSNSEWSAAIIIPAFNREKFIAQAIESAIAQTLPADEIIVVDDGSTDRTVEIAKKYIPSIKLIQIENNGAGPSRPRNVGIAAARSKYILLLDSDDLLDHTVLEKHSSIYVKHHSIGLVCNNFRTAQHINGNNVELKYNTATTIHSIEKEDICPAAYLVRSKIAYSAYCTGNFIKTPGTSFPKSVWESVGKFDETLPTVNDYAFFLRILAKNDIVYIDEPLETIILHDGNISTANVVRKEKAYYYLSILRVLRQEYNLAECLEDRQALRKRIRILLNELAYDYRSHRLYSKAYSAYFEFLCEGGELKKGMLGLAKMPVCWLLDCLNMV